MTCQEFERVLTELAGEFSFEQERHLRTCLSCSELMSDLRTISQQAQFLSEDAEPSPRVWNAIDITLRQEGLIHDSSPVRSAPPGWSRWRPVWLVPALATALVISGVILHQRTKTAPATVSQVAASLQSPESTMVPEEEQLLKLVATQAPALRASYESDLRAVDAYIRDAESSVRSNPNDEVAQEYLMNAYEQRAMVYEMAMDRSQP